MPICRWWRTAARRPPRRPGHRRHAHEHADEDTDGYAHDTPTRTPTATPTSTRTATPANTPTNTPGPGGWITLLEEGFETTPGPLWRFLDNNGANFGAYQWGRRDCRPYAGSYSAWAVGGGADGEKLACGSTYPDNVATTMTYGPFSLADAKMAQMRFNSLRAVYGAGDDFCWYASDDNVLLTPR